MYIQIGLLLKQFTHVHVDLCPQNLTTLELSSRRKGIVSRYIWIELVDSISRDSPDTPYMGSSGKNGTVKISYHRWYLKPKPQDSTRKFGVPFMPLDPQS